MHRASPRRRASFARFVVFIAVGFVLTIGAWSSARGNGWLELRPRSERTLPTAAELFRPFLPNRGDAYELDDIERFVPPRGELPCPSEAIVAYRGVGIRYDRTAFVHRAFVDRLGKLEAIVAEVAVELYGRAPRRLVHRGAYNCRRARGRPERMSEHALGNALDEQGFDFGPLPRGAAVPEGLPKHLRRGFGVRVARHWSASRERDLVHARFLHAITDRLHLRPDVVRGIVGPPARRHHDHLHVDAAPWRYAWYRHD